MTNLGFRYFVIVSFNSKTIINSFKCAFFPGKSSKENCKRRKKSIKETYDFHPASGLSLHLLFNAQQEKSFNCDYCTKSFRQKRDLDRHILTHTGEKPYTCHLCGKGFARKDKLIAHFRTHSDLKMYT